MMDRMTKSITSVLSNGELSETRQRQILNLLSKLDDIKIFHGDTNLENYMFTGKKLKVIDFGFSKVIDRNLIKKLKTSKPNFDLILVSLILKMRQNGIPNICYTLLLQNVPSITRKKYGL